MFVPPEMFWSLKITYVPPELGKVYELRSFTVSILIQAVRKKKLFTVLGAKNEKVVQNKVPTDLI
jgi:hypothetical protein